MMVVMMMMVVVVGAHGVTAPCLKSQLANLGGIQVDWYAPCIAVVRRGRLWPSRWS